MSRTVKFYIENFPPALKAAIRERIDQGDATSFADCVNGILASRYGLAFEPSGARGEPLTETTEISWRMPEPLHRAVKVAAARKRGATMRGEVIAALSATLGVSTPVAA